MVPRVLGFGGWLNTEIISVIGYRLSLILAVDTHCGGTHL
jgi:hypothetical protein